MKLTVQLTDPVYTVSCVHCDSRIDLSEDREKFVAMNFKRSASMAGIGLNFHEDCFGKVLRALNKFDSVFIQERSSEKNKRKN